MPCHGIEVGPTPTRSVIVGVWNPLNEATAAIGYFLARNKYYYAIEFLLVVGSIVCGVAQSGRALAAWR